jgi:(2Fe-2S) ferredoxin
VDTVLDVVVHRTPSRDGHWWARSDHDLAVRVVDGSAHAGRRVAVRIDADGERAEIVA